MTKQAVIIAATNERVTSNQALENYVKSTRGTTVQQLVDGELDVIIKTVDRVNQSTEKIRLIAGSIARDLGKLKMDQATIAEDTLTTSFSKIDKNKATTAFVEGWHLGSYDYTTYKSKEALHKTELHIEGEDVASAVKTGEMRAQAMAFSRDLMNDIPSELHPETFPKRLQKELADTDVKIDVFDKKKLEEMEMNGLLTVGQGSEHAPVFVEMSYQGDASKPLVALVGKGVTYDTGGINIKKGRHLSDMRMDMGGAAAVAGAMKLLAESQA